jgi:hypothetical protein
MSATHVCGQVPKRPGRRGDPASRYCFRLLQEYVPRYETYDVLDDNQLTAFLSREATDWSLKQPDANNRLFASIEAFLRGVTGLLAT